MQAFPRKYKCVPNLPDTASAYDNSPAGTSDSIPSRSLNPFPCIPYTSDVHEQIHKCTIAAQIVHAIVMYYVGQHSYTNHSVQQPTIKQF